jgi:hypothetical protein
MPKEYIARLVLDRRHRSVAIIRRGGMVRSYSDLFLGIFEKVFDLRDLSLSTAPGKILLLRPALCDAAYF